jgi:hypothetical protein
VKLFSFTYLFLFYLTTLSVAEIIASNCRMISKWWIGNNLEWSSCGLLWGIIRAIAWKDRGKPGLSLIRIASLRTVIRALECWVGSTTASYLADAGFKSRPWRLANMTQVFFMVFISLSIQIPKVFQIRLRLFLSTCFPVQCPVSILPFNAIQSGLVTGLSTVCRSESMSSAKTSKI